MNKHLVFFKKLRKTPFNIFVIKVFFKIYKIIYTFYVDFDLIQKDKRLLSKSKKDKDLVLLKLKNKYQVNYHENDILNKYLKHEFDILGSGYQDFNRKCISLDLIDKNILNENIKKKHIAKCEILLSKIKNKNYKLINWNIDIKSGFEWSTNNLSKDIYKKIGNNVGVDIKIPWELCRFNHLPQLAILAINDGSKLKKLYDEFKNQVIDFYSFNPVGYGVNWSCTMDVSIRVSNLIIAFKIFDDDTPIVRNDPDFENLFLDIVYLHSKFIYTHLEYHPLFTNNHYLSNICGLVFSSSFLTSTSETDKWLSFAIQEYFNEFDKQFYNDGSNFEASTAYHCLSSEMIIYTAAVILGLNKKRVNKIFRKYTRKTCRLYGVKELSKQKFSIKNNEILFSDNFELKLSKAFHFLDEIINPEGNIVQIGDNDSGSFLKLKPDYHINKNTLNWEENNLKKNKIKAAFNGIFNLNDPLNNLYPDYEIIQSLARNRSLKYTYKECLKPILSELKNNLSHDLMSFKLNHDIIIPKNTLDIKNVSVSYFENFGLIVWKNKRIWLSLYFGGVGQCGNGGHSHNDKLSINLYIDKKPIFIDPGTYLYTSNPKERNIYRSYKSHPFAINVSDFENEFKEHSLFSFNEKFDYEIKSISNNLAEVYLKTKEKLFIRTILIKPDKILINTVSNKTITISNNNMITFSKGYGYKD